MPNTKPHNLHHAARRALFTALSITLLIGAGLAEAAAQSPAAHNKVTICHRTGSATNPYIMITPDVEGVIEGHLDHDQTGNGESGDIIPEVTYLGQTYSKNLDTDFGNGLTGARILSRGCRSNKGYPTPSPTPRYPRPTPPPSVPVPEPITILMFGSGLASIGLAARKRFGRKASEIDDDSAE